MVGPLVRSSSVICTNSLLCSFSCFTFQWNCNYFLFSLFLTKAFVGVVTCKPWLAAERRITVNAFSCYAASIFMKVFIFPVNLPVCTCETARLWSMSFQAAVKKILICYFCCCWKEVTCFLTLCCVLLAMPNMVLRGPEDCKQLKGISVNVACSFAMMCICSTFHFRHRLVLPSV